MTSPYPAAWATVRYWLRFGDGLDVVRSAVTFPELVARVRPLAPEDADAIRLLAPGETFARGNLRVTRLGGSS
jgi:hypothetical protein